MLHVIPSYIFFGIPHIASEAPDIYCYLAENFDYFSWLFSVVGSGIVESYCSCQTEKKSEKNYRRQQSSRKRYAGLGCFMIMMLEYSKKNILPYFSVGSVSRGL